MIKTTIPSYRDLFEVVSSNRLSGSVPPQKRERIEEFLDYVVSYVRRNFRPDRSVIRHPFEFDRNQDIKDDVTEILRSYGYRFSIEKYDLIIGWCWKMEFYVPK